MAASGNAIFANLPLLFAIGVAIGLTDNDGVAALAGTVGYVVFLAAMGVCAKLRGIETTAIMGIPSIETGVFGGIIVGLIAAAAFNRFYRIQLPSYLGFFAGKRSVPIITAFAVIAVGVAAELHLAADRRRDQCFLTLGGTRAAGARLHHLRRRRARAHPVRAAPRLECPVLFRGRRLHRSRDRQGRARRNRALHRRRPDRGQHDRRLSV